MGYTARIVCALAALSLGGCAAGDECRFGAECPSGVCLPEGVCAIDGDAGDDAAPRSTTRERPPTPRSATTRPPR